VSKFELPETQFVMTVMDKITCQTHLEWKNYSFQYIFGTLIKIPIQ